MGRRRGCHMPSTQWEKPGLPSCEELRFPGSAAMLFTIAAFCQGLGWTCRWERETEF